jgi:LPXTG-site transpeptidase (sortase) family protein
MESLIEQLWSRKYVFLGTFFVVFTFSYLILMAMDFLPEPPGEATPAELRQDAGSQEGLQEASSSLDGSAVSVAEATEAISSSDEVAAISSGESGEAGPAVLPSTLTIAKLGRTVSVLNPTSRTIADLDAALLEGVVRHPDSATLEQDGNVFILGHSSYLPQVFNKNFQALNGIQNLEWGDTIELRTQDQVFEYRVEKVYRAQAQDLMVPIAGTGKMLTLATCNSFGSVDDRYIVEAKQIAVRAL